MSSEPGNAHLDEGLIHAWLDGALDAGEAARVEAHVALCESCAASIAEARGLIAGSSRVVSMLDATPAPLVRIAPPVTPTAGPTAWRLLRVTPARAAIAALLIVAVGVTLTRQRFATDGGVVPMAPKGSEPLAVADATPDSLLSSAIVEKLKREQPPRVLSRGAAPSVSTPAATDAASAPAATDPTASMRVAAALSSIKAQRDSTVPADRARAGFAASASAPAASLQQVVTAAKAAEIVASEQLAGRVAGAAVPLLTAGGCYRIESTAPDAKWGTVSLPVTIAFDATGRGARVLDSTGAPTDESTVAKTATADSIQLRLRRIGYSGTMHLAPLGDALGGTMRSSAATMQLSEVVVTSSDVASSQGSNSARGAKSAPGGETRAAALAPAKPAPTPVSEAGIAVTARRVTCPVR